MPTFSKQMVQEIFKDKFNENACVANLIFPQEIIEKVHAWTQKQEGILFFSGNPGLGKTFLCCAICNYFNDQNLSWKYYSCNDFLRAVRAKIGEGWDYTSYITYIATDPFLFVLDDIGENVTNTDWQKEVIAYLIDFRFRSNLPTIITSNHSLNQFGFIYGQRIFSRISALGNLILDNIQWIDKRKTNTCMES